MLHPGKAVKVDVYLSESATHHGVQVYSIILAFLTGESRTLPR